MRAPAAIRSDSQPLPARSASVWREAGLISKETWVVALPPVDDFRHDREVPEPGVSRRADHDLEDRLSGDLTNRDYVAGAGRGSDQRLQPGQVDAVGDVVACAWFRPQLGVVLFAILIAQELEDRLVRREHGCGRAQFGAHVRDDMAVHRGQARQAVTVVFDDAVHPALDPVPPQHLEHDVLG
jgi:hypothetical protein